MREAIDQFFGAWMIRDWEAMGRATQRTWRFKHPDPPPWLQSQYGAKHLQRFQFRAIAVAGPCAVRAAVEIRYTLDGGSELVRVVRPMIIREIAPYLPSENGEWGVNPISTLREEESDV